jgi:hypothetical protein
MYNSSLRHIHDLVLSSLKMKSILSFFLMKLHNSLPTTEERRTALNLARLATQQILQYNLLMNYLKHGVIQFTSLYGVLTASFWHTSS